MSIDKILRKLKKEGYNHRILAIVGVCFLVSVLFAFCVETFMTTHGETTDNVVERRIGDCMAQRAMISESDCRMMLVMVACDRRMREYREESQNPYGGSELRHNICRDIYAAHRVAPSGNSVVVIE